MVTTNLGNGVLFLPVIAYLMIRKDFRQAGQVVLVFLLTTVFVQISKYAIHEARPKTYFEGRVPIHLIAGVTHSGFSSFPSGHTTTVFALAMILACYSKHKSRAWLFLLPAMLTAYSRIYLSQHFPVDVLIGSLVGVGSSLLVYGRQWTIPLLVRTRPLVAGYKDLSL